MRILHPSFSFGWIILLAPALFLGPASAEEHTAWQSLIVDEQLDNWQAKPASLSHHWSVEDSVIRGANPDKKGSVLWTQQPYEDFVLKVQFLSRAADYDSGIYLRGRTHQVQIGVSRQLDRDLTGCIYAPKDGKGPYPAMSKQAKKAHQPDDWNQFRIRVHGKQITTFLNGQRIVDYQAKVLPAKGPIGLQLHQNLDMWMHFRKIMIRPINDDG
jgi:hypothetical protein